MTYDITQAALKVMQLFLNFALAVIVINLLIGELFPISASYFMMLAHNDRGRCWWDGSRS